MKRDNLSKINKTQLRMGIKVEHEHTKHIKSKKLANERAKRIAEDHLIEFSGQPYYTNLKRMEKSMENKARKMKRK